MTFVDILLILILLGAIVVGYSKGLVKQLASLVSWVAAILLCYKFGDLVQDIFLAISFLIVMLVIRLAMRLSKKILKATKLGFVDHLGGALLFLFKYAFIVSIVLNLLFAINPDMDTFGTKHMFNNKPYEFTLDLMPRVLGSNKMPSDSLKLYRDSIEITTPQP